MAEKPEKPKKKAAKPKKADKSVLGSLPATRPERIGRDREAAAEAKPARATPAPRKPRTPRAKPSAARTSATEPNGTSATSPPPIAPPPSDPAPIETTATTAGRPRPVRAGAPGITPGDGREALAGEEDARHSPTDVAVGMIRAAGELTRLSISAWAEFVKRATRRR